MHSVGNTIIGLFNGSEDLFLLWLLVSVFPVAAAMALSRFGRLNHGRRRGVVEALAIVFGYFFLLLLFFILPLLTFGIYVSPVLLDIFPASRWCVGLATSAAHFLIAYWALIFPVVWPVWVVWVLRRKLS